MSSKPLRVGSYLAPALKHCYRAIGDALANQLDTQCDFRPLDDFAVLTGGGVDVAFLCGLPYVQLQSADANLELLAAPVTSIARAAGHPIYWSDVVTRIDEAPRCLEDFSGRRFGFNDPRSLSGFYALADALIDRASNQLFSEVLCCGSHEQAIDALLKRQIDGVAIDSHLLAVLCQRKPELRHQLRVVESLGPFPIQPVVLSATSQWDPSTLRRLLLGLNADLVPQLGDGLIHGFTHIADSAYDRVRTLTSRIVGACPTDLMPWAPRSLTIV